MPARDRKFNWIAQAGSRLEKALKQSWPSFSMFFSLVIWGLHLRQALYKCRKVSKYCTSLTFYSITFLCSQQKYEDSPYRWRITAFSACNCCFSYPLDSKLASVPKRCSIQGLSMLSMYSHPMVERGRDLCRVWADSLQENLLAQISIALSYYLLNCNHFAFPKPLFRRLLIPVNGRKICYNSLPANNCASLQPIRIELALSTVLTWDLDSGFGPRIFAFFLLVFLKYIKRIWFCTLSSIILLYL